MRPDTKKPALDRTNDFTHYARLVLVFALLGAGCAPANPVSDDSPHVDESSITSVWHKAKIRGVSFRAIGQEPAWLLEITTGSEILLVSDYGATRTAYSYVEPKVDVENRNTRYVTGDGDVEIFIEGEDCSDIMSGERFSTTVTVTVRKRQLTGCGRALH